jgi:hypothetical protein
MRFRVSYHSLIAAANQKPIIAVSITRIAAVAGDNHVSHAFMDSGQQQAERPSSIDEQYELDRSNQKYEERGQCESGVDATWGISRAVLVYATRSSGGELP